MNQTIWKRLNNISTVRLYFSNRKNSHSPFFSLVFFLSHICNIFKQLNSFSTQANFNFKKKILSISYFLSCYLKVGNVTKYEYIYRLDKLPNLMNTFSKQTLNYWRFNRSVVQSPEPFTKEIQISFTMSFFQDGTFFLICTIIKLKPI